ncbi:Trehalose utilisation [Singulisphaera sp. GP187]|uniref:ThuA domain-containing protein n=1 Tax=Singulisphaera sp. GP187 TaxID=1882752 RepID=UPI00092864A5|nr:ThuA domain-containing protein [Singulisphaera sp. GP187]SIN73817.1 Trehalose utilisation [Singulisphaera sp. GP187]
MPSRRVLVLAIAAILSPAVVPSGRAAEPAVKLPSGINVEEQPTAPDAVKIVLIAGSSTYKPGEHDYLAGCVTLMNLLRQSPHVVPVLAIDWPKKPETLEGAQAIVMLFDGGDKHALLKDDRLALIEKLADKEVGIVQLHQAADYPKKHGDRVRSLVGGAWEQGYSQRAHWVAKFETFSAEPIFRGVTPFSVDDGWLTRLRFAPEKKGVTALLRTVSPKDSKTKESDDGAIVSWLYERPDGARSFTFTGGHLHQSFAEEGYRRFLVNGILWTAGVAIPASGAPVALNPTDLNTSAPAKPN